jgi:hypothetical protein
MKTYRITASITKFYETEIEAENIDDAYAQAETLSGSDFEPVRGRFADEFGNWTIENAEEVKT